MKAGIQTTVIHFDHMNDYQGYTKLLSKWTKQLRLGGVLFLSLHCKPRPRHIFAVLDSPPIGGGGTAEFLTRLRTQNVDVNMRGKPCKERMSTVIAEFPSLLLSTTTVDDNWEHEQMSSIGDIVLDGFKVVESEGTKGSQTHMPYVRDWIREFRPEDAETIITAMDNHLNSTTKPNKRR